MTTKFAKDLSVGDTYLGFPVIAVSAPFDGVGGLVVKVTVATPGFGVEDFFPMSLAMVTR